jgi:hypothetical protein
MEILTRSESKDFGELEVNDILSVAEIRPQFNAIILLF